MPALTAAARLIVDRGFGSGSAEQLNQTFLIGMGVVSVLALATAGRFFFVSLLGERVVADLRKSVYRHILTLDASYFLKTRTGEVLSRLTTDVTLIETLVGTSASVALRNILSTIGATIVMFTVSPMVFLESAAAMKPTVTQGTKNRPSWRNTSPRERPIRLLIERV